MGKYLNTFITFILMSGVNNIETSQHNIWLINYDEAKVKNNNEIMLAKETHTQNKGIGDSLC